MAPVVRELAKRESARSIVCVTGQHKEMLQEVLQLFGIRPDFDLAVMRHNQSLPDLTSRLLTGLAGVVERLRPEWILAQGDTTTVLASALTAYYHRVRFGHVEAGLRTGDPWSPFPEEMNRKVADAFGDLLFAPTAGARQALLREGFADDRILVTGNTVIDSLEWVLSMPYDWMTGPLRDLTTGKRLVLVTVHRRESFGEPLRRICAAVLDLACRLRDSGVHFALPVHLNPNVAAQVSEILAACPNVSLLPPLDYRSMVHLMKSAEVILTDSGGIQEEAPALRVPVLVVRDTTERPEGVSSGAVRLIGTDVERIVTETMRLLLDEGERDRMRVGGRLYGDGHAARRIADALCAPSA